MRSKSQLMNKKKYEREFPGPNDTFDFTAKVKDQGQISTNIDLNTDVVGYVANFVTIKTARKLHRGQKPCEVR